MSFIQKFFEELRVHLNFKNYILLFEFMKIIVVKIFNANQVGKIFQLADFFHLAIFCQVEECCELEKLAKCVSCNFLLVRIQDNRK